MIDTCVWLDIAKDPSQFFLIDTLETVVREKKAKLLVPRIVIDEFERNQDRISKENTQSFNSVVKRVKDSINKYGDKKRRKRIVQALEDISHKTPFIDAAATEILNRIRKLLNEGQILEISEEIKLAAINRAIESKAPFHRQKNSVGDSIIIETYARALKKQKTSEKYTFVTHNTKDFSQVTGDLRIPHPDIAILFSKIKSVYSVRLGDALKRISPSDMSELMRQREWNPDPRELSEILEALDEMWDMIWYNRHQNLRYKIHTKKIKIVPKGTEVAISKHGTVIHQDILDGALKAAARIEKKYGVDQLGPWSDFEWGMLNGKLSALRWVLGEDWDFLDT